MIQYQIQIENKVRSFFIRTLCSYEPYFDKSLPGKGLKFKPGDLMFVINSNDNQWWRAVHIRRNMLLYSDVNSINVSRDRGLIPSFERVSKKNTLPKRHVEFDAKTVVIGPSGKLLSEMINTSGCSSLDSKRLLKISSSRRTFCGPAPGENFANPYQIIEQTVVNSPRPVVVVGPGQDAIYEYLLREYPDKFTTPIPYTTRSARPGEIDGVDYHCNRNELEDAVNANKYIDVGKFKGNLYANSVESVRQAIDKKKHPLLDISHKGIEKLRCAEIYPICILVATSSLHIATLLQGDHSRVAVDIQATREYALKLEKEFSVLFDVILSPTTAAEMKEQVIMLVNLYQQLPTWTIASDQSSLKGADNDT